MIGTRVFIAFLTITEKTFQAVGQQGLQLENLRSVILGKLVDFTRTKRIQRVEQVGKLIAQQRNDASAGRNIEDLKGVVEKREQLCFLFFQLVEGDSGKAMGIQVAKIVFNILTEREIDEISPVVICIRGEGYFDIPFLAAVLISHGHVVRQNPARSENIQIIVL